MVDEQEMPIEGGCLCGAVGYSLQPPFSLFQYCHCSRCQKSSGSAHASNLFAPAAQLRWLRGEDQVQHFRLPDTEHYGTAFCRHCGSAMPWLARAGQVAIVPAGGLEQAPPMMPKQSIFWDSRADWYICPEALPKHAELPLKRQ